MITNRFYSVSPATYEQARTQLDSLYGHPSPIADTVMAPATEAVKHGDNVIACVHESHAAMPAVSAAIEQLTAAGLATEISADEYFALTDTLPKL